MILWNRNEQIPYPTGQILSILKLQPLLEEFPESRYLRMGLRDRYGIQIEFGDIGNILAYVSIGDRELYLDRLIGALNDIKRIYSKDKTGMLDHEYINPIVKLSPQDAFYGNKKSVPIEQSSGKISGEFVMCYPPGIPILAPGELITAEIIEYIKYAKEKGCSMTGTEDINIERLNVLKGV